MMSTDTTTIRPSVLAILAVAILLVVAVLFLYKSSARKDAELAASRLELQKQLAQAEEARAQEAAAHKAELERVREETALREEIRRLRDDAQQKAQAQGAQTLIAAAQLQQQERALKLQEAAQKAQTEAVQREACISNLRLIDKAKQNWATRRFNTEAFSPGRFFPDRNRIADTIPPYHEIATYFNGSTLPTCPAGGTYTLNAVKAAPSCSIPGHVLPE